MKHHIRALTCGFGLLAATACGDKQTIASKSAASFDEAKRKGAPVAPAEHGGHAEPPSATATELDHHAAMPGMDHSTMTGIDHSHMSADEHAQMSGMDHSGMKGMDHSKMDHSQMDHSTMPAMQHMHHAAPPTASAPRPAVIAPPPPPTTSDPVETLRPDEFDAPPSHREDS